MAAGVGVGGCGFALAPHPGAAASSTPAPVLAPGIELLHGGHPVPDAVGVESSRKILDAVSALGVGDRLLYLVSGGSSALFEVPDPRIEQADLLTAHDELVRSGANIAEINSVRRALSRTKGGRLAAAARPASVLTLAISDVAGDDPAIIGSGPTVAPTGADRDGSTAALEIIRRYRLESVLAPAVLETLARPEPCGPANVEGFVVLASVATACAQARCVLEERGYRCVSPPDGRLAGDASDAARTLAELARTLAARPERLALVLGGETTLRVPAGAGSGGRNQHIAALLALELRDLDGVAAVVAGTDGRDGNSCAAGGVVDAGTAARAERAGAPLGAAVEAFDTATALAAAGDSLVTGPTGTNVEDLVVITSDGR
jgi:glycerate 2-kinase